ncbi:MAG: DUF4249 domain-containing protein [Cyclobacteriaceae bacterium]|nr:DUF4249 domain-containing protein [Cyclobacteriaceae bacterium]MCH8516630.1 DUF4249 domain-containing protein [Cyclobacteriaceae bacterium]
MRTYNNPSDKSSNPNALYFPLRLLKVNNNAPFLMLLFLFFTISSCRDIIDLELEEAEPRLVVEAMLLDDERAARVKLTRSNTYFTVDDFPVVTNAVVHISDEDGNRHELIYDENLEQFTNTNLRAELGRSYLLHISSEWGEYTAENKAMPVGILDSLTQRFVVGTPFQEEGYYLRFSGRTDPNQVNYFRFKVYRNDTLFNSRSDILVFSDRNIGNTIRNLQLNYAFQPDDVVKVEKYSLNRDIRDYFSELQSLLFNDGGLFSPPPVNPPSNIMRTRADQLEALGFFQVSQVIEETVVIEARESLNLTRTNK